MQYRNQQDDSEESRIDDKEETSSNTNIEKLNSCWFVIFKYWILIAAIWGLIDLFTPFSSDFKIGTKLELSTFDRIRLFIGGYPLKIWDIANCVLAFEGIRRKNLNILLRVVPLMEAFMGVQIVITFLNLTSEAGMIVGKKLFEEGFLGMKPDKGFLSFLAVLIVLVWCAGYYLIYLYGVKKARDILRDAKRNSKRL